MNSTFWDHLLAVANTIAESEPTDQDLSALIKTHLESIDMLYQRTFDPADTYPEYVAVALCRAIYQTLQRN